MSGTWQPSRRWVRFFSLARQPGIGFVSQNAGVEVPGWVAQAVPPAIFHSRTPPQHSTNERGKSQDWVRIFKLALRHPGQGRFESPLGFVFSKPSATARLGSYRKIVHRSASFRIGHPQKLGSYQFVSFKFNVDLETRRNLSQRTGSFRLGSFFQVGLVIGGPKEADQGGPSDRAQASTLAKPPHSQSAATSPSKPPVYKVDGPTDIR